MNETRRRRIRDRSSGTATLISEGCRVSGVITGNCDFQVNGEPADYYAFLHKGVRFIGLCDAGTHDHIGQFCSENIIPRGQCEWLKEQLQKPEKRKILFAHIPPHPKNKDVNGYLSRNDSIYLNDLVSKYRPEAMFFGHQHRKTRSYHSGETLSANAIVLGIVTPNASSGSSALADVEVALNPDTAGSVACNASNGIVGIAVLPNGGRGAQNANPNPGGAVPGAGPGSGGQGGGHTRAPNGKSRSGSPNNGAR